MRESIMQTRIGNFVDAYALSEGVYICEEGVSGLLNGQHFGKRS
jgi:hypothetical protein